MRTTISTNAATTNTGSTNAADTNAVADNSADSSAEARRLRFAATWHRRSGGGDGGAGSSSSDPALRPAYPAPVAAPEAPPAGALHATVESLTPAGEGETLILRDADGRRLHFYRDGLFRWSTRTATDVLVDAGAAPGPTPRRLWVRHPGNGTWWTDTAVCHAVDCGE
ncbi:hypothetical protein ACFWGD_04355 [Corynebacterium sp. NPDC060344]|uniref:hypothetical protein n=1 Tax=Corynebacterium sp. NPDC060344 TaxID=3347101 RepID=UPI003649DFB6